MGRVLLLWCAACTFRHGNVGLDAPAVDAPVDVIDAIAIDAPAMSACTPDSHLTLCYSFDAATFPAMMANEGTATTAVAQLTNVTRTMSPAGGAALLDATSEIFVPYTADVAGIQSIEMWLRIDQDAAAGGGREGLVDSNVASPNNISLFFYNQDPNPHQLRCGLGNAVIVLDAPTFPTAQWLYVACTCDAGAIHIYVDGTSLGATAADCAGGGAFSNPDGFTIGSNNNGGPTGVNDWLVGAIDGVKLWNETLSAETVCAHAGRSGC